MFHYHVITTILLYRRYKISLTERATELRNATGQWPLLQQLQWRRQQDT